MKGLSVCVVALLAAAATVPVLSAEAPAPTANPQKHGTGFDISEAVGGKATPSQCSKDCYEKAKKYGFDKMAADSAACFAPYKGKRLSAADCCDKAELLFGRGGPLAHCMCCPEFVSDLLHAVPVDKFDITHAEFLETLNLCRVPLVGQKSCSPRVAKERATLKWVPALEIKPAVNPWPKDPAPLGQPSNKQPLAVGSNGPMFSPITFDRPLIEQLNLTGVYNIIGFEEKFSSPLLASQGREAIAAGQIGQLKVAGASHIYNDYITGFMMFIEVAIPRYNTPLKSNKLPPLPPQYKDDIAWVANLRRGPYPDLVKWRPAAFSPAATDPLQNGKIARMSPGVVFAGRVESMNSP